MKKIKVTHDENCSEFEEGKRVCQCTLEVFSQMAGRIAFLENELEKQDKKKLIKPNKGLIK